MRDKLNAFQVAELIQTETQQVLFMEYTIMVEQSILAINL